MSEVLLKEAAAGMRARRARRIAGQLAVVSAIALASGCAPRKPGEIDAENRSAAIDLYRDRGVSDEFLGNSEIDY